MPHVIVKTIEGKTEEQKVRLAEQIVKDVMATMKCGEDAVSVAMEDLKYSDWTEAVYQPDIVPHRDELYKKPGYEPF